MPEALMAGDRGNKRGKEADTKASKAANPAPEPAPSEPMELGATQNHTRHKAWAPDRDSPKSGQGKQQKGASLAKHHSPETFSAGPAYTQNLQ